MVGGGNMVERWASRMAVVDRKLERCRIVNRRQAADRPNQRDLVKIALE
jgi:predicted Zn-dependent protease